MPTENTIPLSTLQSGEIARVIKIQGEEYGRFLKLSSLGIVPGSLIRFQQRWPACILWIGETMLSLDEEVAQDILVQKV